MDKKSLFWLKWGLFLRGKYWLPLFKEAFVYAWWYFVTAFFVGLVLPLLSFVFAILKKEDVDMDGFFHPYLLPSLFFVFVCIYIWHLMFVVAKKLHEYRLDATLLTWKDISFQVEKIPPGNGYGLGLKVISHKPKYAHPAGEWREYSITAIPKIETLQESGDTVRSRIELPTVIMKGKSIFKKSQEFLNIRHFKKENVFTFIPIADFENERAWITDKDGRNDIFLNYGKRYIAQIEMRETVIADRHAPDGCAVWCELYFYKNENGQSDLSINILNRVPDFETW